MVERKIPETLDEAYKLAAEAKPALDSFGERLAERLGCEFQSAPLKGRERAEEKLRTKYRGDMSQLQDLARGRLICDTLEQIDEVKKIIEAHVKPVRAVDRMDKPTENGYRDVKYILPAPNGGVVEMQIQLRDLDRADKMTHKEYEKIRAITAGAKDRPLTEAEQKEIALRQKRCKELYVNAAFDYNKRTTGRKLKVEGKPQSALMLQAKNAKIGGR